ncbi:MAG: glycosyltransferase family 4 protein [Gemmatimonadota bacterium]
MRLALLTNFVPPYRVPLYEALEREAGELTVFISTDMESNRLWQVDWRNLDVVRQRTLTLHRQWRTAAFTEGYELHVPYDTIAQLRRYRPDAIITGEMGARSIQAALYGRVSRTPVILWAMLSDRLELMRNVIRQTARRWLVRNVDVIITNGAAGARYFLRMGVPDRKLLRVNQAIDLKPFLPLAIEKPPAEVSHLLYVGSISERKGVAHLLTALNQWARAHPERSVSLTLVGDGALRPQLEAQPVAPNLERNWIGGVQYHELPAWYARGDILAFPTLGDEWGLVVNEALASGLPVLGSAYSQAVEELIADDVNGWICRPDDAASISSALQRALNTTRERLQQMRSAARERIRAVTPEYAAARIVQRVREVLAQ